MRELIDFLRYLEAGKSLLASLAFIAFMTAYYVGGTAIWGDHFAAIGTLILMTPAIAFAILWPLIRFGGLLLWAGRKVASMLKGEAS